MMNPDPTYKIALFFRDDDGAVGQVRVAIPVGIGYAGARAYALALGNIMAEVSSAALWKIAISHRYVDVSSPVAAPGASANKRLVLIFNTVSAYRYVHTIPGITPTLIDPDGIGVNPDNLAIAALVAAWQTGISGAIPVAPWNSNITGGGGGGGDFGGGGGGGDFGGDGGGGDWEDDGGGGGGTYSSYDYFWTGDVIADLAAVYWGYERVGW